MVGVEEDGLGSIPFSTIGTDLEQFVLILSLLITFLQFLQLIFPLFGGSLFRFAPRSASACINVKLEAYWQTGGGSQQQGSVTNGWFSEDERTYTDDVPTGGNPVVAAGASWQVPASEIWRTTSSGREIR